MYLKRLKFRNAQRFQKIEFNLTPGFNCIFGKNDKGKSTFVRCWKWLVDNKPSGDWMRKITKKTEVVETISVSALFDTDTVIKRLKGKGINKYVLDGEEYNDIGTSIPADISDVLDFGDKFTRIPNMNIKTDEDKTPFLVTSSGSEFGTLLNELVGVSDYEDTVKEFQKDERKCVADIKYSNSSKEACEEKLKSLKNMKRIKELFKMATKYEKQYKTNSELILKLKSLKKRCLSINSKQLKLNIRIYDKVLNIENSFKGVINTFNLLDRLKVLSVSINKCSKADKVKDFTKSIDNINESLKSANESFLFKEELVRLREKIVLNGRQMITCKTDGKEIAKKLKNFVGSVCSTCGSKITLKGLNNG